MPRLKNSLTEGGIHWLTFGIREWIQTTKSSFRCPMLALPQKLACPCINVLGGTDALTKNKLCKRIINVQSGTSYERRNGDVKHSIRSLGRKNDAFSTVNCSLEKSRREEKELADDVKL